MRYFCFFLLLGCGGDSNRSIRTAPELNTCTNVKESQSPFIVEWSGAERGDLEAMMDEGTVVARYDGCQQLKILTACSGPGRYRFKSFSTPRVDVVAMKSKQELYASLPVGAANIEGALGNGGQVDLRYALVGTQRATAHPTRAELKGYCKGATHYVSDMSVGAFSLEQLDAQEQEAQTSTLTGGNATASQRTRRRLLRRDGDVDECALTERCRAPVRVTLIPISGSVDAGGAPAASTVAISMVQTKTPAPRKGGTVRVGLPFKLEPRYDLKTRVYAFNSVVRNHVMEPLVGMRSDGSARLNLLDGLEVSKDGLTVTLTLKPSIYFHPHPCLSSSREADAEDLLYSLNTFQAMNRFEFNLDSSNPVVLRDRYSVQFKLKSRDIYFPESLKEVSLLPKELEGCADLKNMTQLAGTGPFMMTSQGTNGVTRLIRNPRYWRKDTQGRSLPHIDALEFLNVESFSQALTEIADDTLDLYIAMRESMKSYVRDPDAELLEFSSAEVRKRVKVGMDRSTVRRMDLFGLMPLGQVGPLSDRNLREAIAWSVNRDVVAKAFGSGTTPYGRLLDASHLGFNPRVVGHDLDLAKARAALARAGYPNGKGAPPLVIGYPKVWRVPALAALEGMKRIGLNVRGVILEGPMTKKAIDQGDVDAVIGHMGHSSISGESPSTCADYRHA